MYSLDVLLSRFGTSRCSMSGSNCCFLTCIQISQEAGQVIWYSQRVFQSLLWSTQPKAFSVVHEADVFLEFSCLFYDPTNVGNLIPGSSAFSKTSLNIWMFTVHVYTYNNNYLPKRLDIV